MRTRGSIPTLATPVESLANCNPAFVHLGASTRSISTPTPAGHWNPCKPSSLAPSCRSEITTNSRCRAGVPFRASSENSSAAVVNASPSWVPIHPGATVANRCCAIAARWSAGHPDHSAKLTSTRGWRSKVNRATRSPAEVLFNCCSTADRAFSHTPCRRMLALVSTNSTSSRPVGAGAVNTLSRAKNGRANPMASRARQRQRSTSSQRCSSFRRRVRRGCVGRRRRRGSEGAAVAPA